MIKCPSPPTWKDQRGDLRLLIVILVVAYGTTPQFPGIGLGPVLAALAVLGLVHPALADLRPLRTAGPRSAAVPANGRSTGAVLVASWAVVLPVARGDAR